MMLGKTSFILSFAGLILLAMPGEQAPASQPQSAEISAVIALPAETPENRGRPVVAPQDQRPDAVKNLRITKEITVTRWLQPGEYVWSAEDAAAARGPATVVVNLRSRTLSVYRGGVELGRSSMLYGFGEHPTPLGTFPVKERKVDHYSRTYNAPMPHMLRLTDDGVALHGSQLMGNDRATHGCIGLPREFAALLYDQVGLGDQVIVWSGRAEG
jgi:lipoprotein-anchoring transpeptidase ErfK/SrfK